MKYSEGKQGRVFVLRLDDGDKIPDCIEQFAAEQKIECGQVILLGSIGSGQLVSGPRDTITMPPDPLLLPIDGAHEVVGAGLLAPGEDGKPVLHIHGALGRAGNTVTGCLRPGVFTWLVAEAIIYEITDLNAARLKDKQSGFVLLEMVDKT